MTYAIAFSRNYDLWRPIEKLILERVRTLARSAKNTSVGNGTYTTIFGYTLAIPLIVTFVKKIHNEK